MGRLQLVDQGCPAAESMNWGSPALERPQSCRAASGRPERSHHHRNSPSMMYLWMMSATSLCACISSSPASEMKVVTPEKRRDAWPGC